MYYSIKGGLKKEKELVVKALWFAKSYLFPRHKNIEIDIELKKNISNQKRFKGYYEVIGNTICISHKKEKVVITFDDIKKANLVREIKI